MSKIDQKELQSYFTSLCKSFYIVYKQVKRLEKEEEEEELKKTDLQGELEVINQLLEMPDEAPYWQKYVTKNCSKEELHARKEELEKELDEYYKKGKKLKYVKKEWQRNYNNMTKAIEELIITIEDNELSITVSSKEEITALMYFYSAYTLSNHKIINTDEKSLKSFPKGKKYQEFYKAYCLEDDVELKKICRKYY